MALFYGTSLRILITAELNQPGPLIFAIKNFIVILTGHVFIIIFYIITPILIEGFGNWLVPLKYTCIQNTQSLGFDSQVYSGKFSLKERSG